MTKKNKQIIILLMVFGCIITIVIVGVFVAKLISFLSYEKPPIPSITKGEFPFVLVYEINGQKITLKDTLIIEYEGMAYNEGWGYYNRWKQYYKSSILSSDQVITEHDFILFDSFIAGLGSTEITFELGSANYYMGFEETDPFWIYKGIKPGDIVISNPKETRAISEEELLKRFDIKIIERHISQPIEQSQKIGDDLAKKIGDGFVS